MKAIPMINRIGLAIYIGSLGADFNDRVSLACTRRISFPKNCDKNDCADAQEMMVVGLSYCDFCGANSLLVLLCFIFRMTENTCMVDLQEKREQQKMRETR